MKLVNNYGLIIVLLVAVVVIVGFTGDERHCHYQPSNFSQCLDLCGVALFDRRWRGSGN